MKAGINLLPAVVLQARRRARRLRRWSLVVIAVAVLSALPVGYDLIQTARASSLEGRAAPMQAKLDTVREDLKQAVSQYETLAIQVARADALRAKRPWAALLSTLTNGLPETAWLTAIETRSPMPVPLKVTEGAGAKAAAGPVVLDGPTGFSLGGYALDHESLYEFMARLKDAGLFTRVELTSAGKEPALQGSAVRFVLICDW